ncbi:hypothetical protein QCM80_45320 [Bradyrhizobium sp. SSUT112]|uniref:hypothetical protein n=1 Tax=Bradyrhizobium sp. SSUT112 TaxID=3040604 RepID=UPI00244D041B|nr:hypothetical protein [Bradyrhizobium sp. SSUT112]MDH2357690.1 hypothetical protein [Bradyrhizobium sp. SSUT112]
MTPKQKAALAYWHYDAGMKHGGDFAQSIINEFPEGFSDAQCDELASRAGASLSSALTAIHKRFHDAFGSGHCVGLRAGLSKYQEALLLRGIGSKQVG